MDSETPLMYGIAVMLSIGWSGQKWVESGSIWIISSGPWSVLNVAIHVQCTTIFNLLKLVKRSGRGMSIGSVHQGTDY